MKPAIYASDGTFNRDFVAPTQWVRAIPRLQDRGPGERIDIHRDAPGLAPLCEFDPDRLTERPGGDPLLPSWRIEDVELHLSPWDNRAGFAGAFTIREVRPALSDFGPAAAALEDARGKQRGRVDDARPERGRAGGRLQRTDGLRDEHPRRSGEAMAVLARRTDGRGRAQVDSPPLPWLWRVDTRSPTFCTRSPSRSRSLRRRVDAFRVFTREDETRFVTSDQTGATRVASR